jgi:hypothetical protein
MGHGKPYSKKEREQKSKTYIEGKKPTIKTLINKKVKESMCFRERFH